MRSLLVLTVAATTAAVTNGYSVTLHNLYAGFCQETTQSSLASDGTSSGALFTDNSPFQFVTGFALGTQVQQNVTESDCFIQANQTKTFLDTMVDSSYLIMSESMAFDFTNLGSNFATLVAYFNNYLI